ncbi:GNAT family N-acetyltransferase [Agilicoccus flavus]|uniref:GNAT family N-acetyltransferase n=1 Tax=Agilicoccus flavus TaxID=2775968 RepID=UPI001CF6C039|nr:GNAT family protein [Agilicoccus flavus]
MTDPRGTSGGPPALTWRPARRSDLPHLLAWTPDEAALATWAGPTLAWPLRLTALEAMLAEGEALGRTSWVALTPGARGVVVGHAGLAVVDDGATVRVGRILLDPARRGSGLGHALVDGIVGRASARPGVERLTLGVVEGNAAARRHYDRLGFTPTGTVLTWPVGGVTWRSVEMARPALLDPPTASTR